MKKRGLWIRDGLHLKPADDVASEALAKIKPGKAVYLEPPVQARNPRQHALYWALVGIVYAHTDAYATRGQLSDAIKCSVGWHEDPITLRDGRVMVKPKSISYANMPQEDFAQFLDKVIAKVCADIIPGLEPGALRDELEQMTGSRP